jgi:hypothetical protein
VPTSNLTFVWSSFVITWIVFIGYAIRVHGALARARKEHDAAIESMERHL